MNDIVWEKPVRVGTGAGYAQSIHGPRDALACLDNHPGLSGVFARKARMACWHALRRREDLQHARQAVIAALLACAIPFA